MEINLVSSNKEAVAIIWSAASFRHGYFNFVELHKEAGSQLVELHSILTNREEGNCFLTSGYMSKYTYIITAILPKENKYTFLCRNIIETLNVVYENSYIEVLIFMPKEINSVMFLKELKKSYGDKNYTINLKFELEAEKNRVENYLYGKYNKKKLQKVFKRIRHQFVSFFTTAFSRIQRFFIKEKRSND